MKDWQIRTIAWLLFIIGWLGEKQFPRLSVVALIVSMCCLLYLLSKRFGGGPLRPGW